MYSGSIVHATHRVRAGAPVVQIYGRLEDGRPFLIEDDRFRPYFFARSQEIERLDPLQNAIPRATELRDFEGQPVSRLTLPTPAALRTLCDRMKRRGLRCFEADLPLVTRYLVDHALLSSVAIDARPRGLRNGMLYFLNPMLGPSECDVGLRMLSLAFATSPESDRVLCAALAAEGVAEAHLLGGEPGTDVVVHEDERELLLSLAARIREIDPDILLGWQLASTDLRLIEERMRRQRLPLRLASLGRIPAAIEFSGPAGYSGRARAEVVGRVVVDALPIVREALRLPDDRLGTAARRILGRDAALDLSCPQRGEQILQLHERAPTALAAATLDEARLVPALLEREGLLELTRQRSLLSGLPMDRVASSIAAFDHLYLPELRRRGHVAPCVESDVERVEVQGGAVLSPEPGLRANVAVYDFKSLYPSLIRTFNLDPLALALGIRELEGAGIRAPNGAHFSRREAILPDIIARFMRRRALARHAGERHAERAIKIMMNAMFGIFAAPGCRFFEPRLANAITGFGQQTLAWTCEACEEEGRAVLYGDTDSLFVQLDPELGRNEALRQAEALRERLAERLAGRIRDTYDVDAHLELELEAVFDRLLLPRSRKGGGSKKRYAGWIADEDRLELVGLEAVRRDWPAVARELQREMLRKLFRNEDMLGVLRRTVERVRAGELDASLVYTRRVRKDSLRRYRNSAPQHVQAARKLEQRLGRLPDPVVRYVITPGGPEPVGPGEAIPRPIDYFHYVERVLRPVAETLLAETGQSFGEALGEPLQLRLL